MLLAGTASDVGAGLQELVGKYHVDTVQLDQEIPRKELPVTAGAGIQELLGKYHVDTVQLDQEIPKKELPVIAAYFDNSVELYSQAMDMNAADQHDVRTALLQHDAQIAMMKCLLKWMQRNPSEATFRTLLELLLRLNKTEVAAEVCQYLAQNVSTHFVKYTCRVHAF